MNYKSILITGGTGSFGKAFISLLLKKYKKIKKIVIFSRDELKQYDLSKKYPLSKFPCMRYFIGDVRDKSRLDMALRDIDVVVHAAALKQVDTAEYNPIETIKTNIVGSQNIVEAAKFCVSKNIELISFSGMKKKNKLNTINNKGLYFWVNSMIYNQIEMAHLYLILAMIDKAKFIKLKNRSLR